MPESPHASHFLWTQPETVWQQLLRPWFAACARIGWEGRGGGNAANATGSRFRPATTGARGSMGAAVSPAAVPADGVAPLSTEGSFTDTADAPVLLVPDAGMVAWVKGRLVAEGIGCLGVHFHTAATLRGLLAQAYGITSRLALREDLHLLMGQAARSLPDNPVAQAAVLDPAALARLCDRIDRAGWRTEGFSTAAGRQLATRYFELLAAQGLRTVADFERELLERAQRAPIPACGYLLAAGFGCEHSDALLLLRAATLSTRRPPILCLDTGGFAGTVATTSAALGWQAACEEYFGIGQPLAADAESTAEDADSPSAASAASPPAADADSPTPSATPTAAADADALSDLPLWAAAAEQGTPPERSTAPPLFGAERPAQAAQSASVESLQDDPQSADTQSLSIALEAWAQALATHSAVEPELRAPLQRGLRLLTFRTLDAEARHTVGLVRHWLSTAEKSSQPLYKEHSEALDADADRPLAHSGVIPARIGIILAGGGSVLGREIAAGLSALGIAHYDSLGHEPARSDAQRLLEGWCNWQNSNQVDDFNAFLAELCRQNRLPPSHLRHWERAADRALSQTLCAELGVIAAWLGRPAAGSTQPAGAPPVEDGAGAGALSQSESQVAINQLLDAWPQLPQEASFADFWAFAQPVLRFCGWPQRQEPLEERARAFGETLTGRLPRSAFINWLRSVTRVPGRTRNALGHEPFATVHVVTLGEASRQQWSHLCVVGMVHGQWPPLEADSALLDPERCAELNRRAERQSRFGQGQSSIGGSHTFLASARQQREYFDAAFLRLLGQTGARQIALSRYRFEPAEQAEAFASEYFLRAVYAATASLDIGESPPPAPVSSPVASVLSQSARPKSPFAGEQLEASEQQPPAIGQELHVAGQRPPATGQELPIAGQEEQTAGQEEQMEIRYPQVALAYTRRRDPHSGFDAYSYALATPPPEPLHLSCSHWAEVLNRPAHAWYRYVLRLRKRRRAAENDFRQQSQGIWVHGWLNPCADRRFGQPPAFVPRPSCEQWRQQVGERAGSLRRSVAGAYIRAGRELPQWWQSDWSAALAIADSFAETLGAQNAAADLPSSGWTTAAGEWPLSPLRLDLEGHPLDGLVLEGFVDLLLASDTTAAGALPSGGQGGEASRRTPAEEQRTTAEEHAPCAGAAAPACTALAEAPALWVIDYKTGSDGSLSLRSWESKGVGLQLILYAFALRARGAGSVQMTLLRKNSRLEPQLDLSELSADAPIWQKLAVPMRAGVFGMRGALRDPHGFTGDYPIATLGVDPVVLERKARLSGLL